MKKKLWFKVISAVLGVIVLATSVSLMVMFRNEPLDYEKIRQQIYDYEMHMADFNIQDINAAAKEAYNALNDDGSFSDIDYTDTAQTNWKPASHLTRLRNLVVSYVNQGGTYYNDSTAYEKIVNGLRFWQKSKPVSTNWYMQEISSPQNIGVMLVMMRFGDEKVPADLEAEMLRYMKKTAGDPKKWTGANKTDISVHYIYRGALTEKSRPIKIGSNEAFSTLCYTTDEGFQYDGSYQQHGPQLYITGYGNAIVNSLASIITAVDGTKYQITAEELDPLMTFINEAYMRVTRGQYRLYNSGGRSLSREGSLDVSGDVLMYEKLKCIDKANAAQYDAVIAGLKGEGSVFTEAKNTHFWRSDYSLYTAPNYTFDVRTVSNRTSRNENGNDENITGYFLADGAYSLTVTGKEYYNIFPVWDFAMIPGTTVPHLKEIPRPDPWSHMGQSSFAGGLSDGKTGISAYGYVDNEFSLNVKANKSYFMLGDCIVCLGSGIKAESAGEMRTTLNQCLSDGDVYIIPNQGDSEKFTQTETVLSSDIKGVYHGNIGYVFYDDVPKTLTNKNQSGKWTDINTSQSNTDTITEKVFTLYESHGEKPTDGSYQYVILPGISSKEAVEKFDKNSIHILSNTETVQAVKTADSDKIYAVFFGAGALEFDNVKITADKPCALLLDGSKLYVSNPDQTVKKVNITVENGNDTKTKAVKLYTGKSELAGKTVVIDL